MIAIFSVGVVAISVSAERDIRVVLNSKELSFDVPPQIIDDRTMVPMRAIFEALGADVEWSGDTQTITATQGDTIITMQIGNAAIIVNGEAITLDVSPLIVDGRTLVPVRAVAEGLNADVEWNAGTRTVMITRKEQAEAIIAGTIEVFDIFTSRDRAIHATRYFFERQRLPEMVFGYQERIINLILNGNANEIEEFFRAEWHLISTGAIANYLMTSDEKYSLDNMPILMEGIARERAALGLGEGHVVSVTLERINSSTNAIIIEMHYTGLWRLGSLIAIAYNEEMGLRCFALERGLVLLMSDDATLYSVTTTERSSLFMISNDRAAFINAIRDVMSESIESDISLRATVTVMSMGSAATRDIEQSMIATVSLYNERGENVTAQFYFGRIELRNNNRAHIIEQNTGQPRLEDGATFHFGPGSGLFLNPEYYAFRFSANWNPDERIDVMVTARAYGRDFIEFRAQNVTIVDMTETWENRLPDGRIVWHR